MEHLYPTRDSIVKELSTIPELTVYNLRKRLNRPKKEIVFVLRYYDKLFSKKQRTPANGRNKHNIWSLIKN
jgi:hypothetical protein